MSRHPGRERARIPVLYASRRDMSLTDQALAFAAGFGSHSFNDHTDNVGNVQRTYKRVRQPLRCSLAMARGRKR